MRRAILRTLATATAAGAMAFAGATPAMADSDLPNFQLGIQLIDNGSEVGQMQMTPFATFGGGCSEWAGDPNAFDPDGARVQLMPAPRGRLGDRDLRFGIQVEDRNGSERGPVEWTKWASEGGSMSAVAYDANRFDPDRARVCLETRLMPAGIDLYDIRASIKTVDLGGGDQNGLRQFTPWLYDGGGFSGWAYDSNAFDPDGFSIGLEVY
ncbi:hypothetical protein [Couchioplanes caeruleus]|uniref:Secreted protein n=2 Tax=Couchioplanes caeruleus TaxID=56438 RepID=A0A1K0GS85_9ACTN|nr:hypothetical protein [Couchioplanes caeruleus]OJF14084.1 hypothetical protein BG844_11655 [Couchioplanes caeruleus subsp. caeruleus]ROP28354.1 hypothetical protein EDD30_1104 [Couchioplanes caeruleus]